MPRVGESKMNSILPLMRAELAAEAVFFVPIGQKIRATSLCQKTKKEATRVDSHRTHTKHKKTRENFNKASKKA